MLAGTNPLYRPHIALEAGVTAWIVEMVLVLIWSLHPVAGRLGVLVAGLFLVIPCSLRSLPIFRFLLMCGMALAFAIASLQLSLAPTAGFRGRLAYVFTWLGTRVVKRRSRRFDGVALLQFVIATLVLAASIAAVKAASLSGLWPARWLAGGIMFLSFAEMATAGHYFLTALIGISAPAWMRSPYLSISIREFWAERWNPAASALIFGKCIFAPLARSGVGLALFAAFLGSAVAHTLLLYMATTRWSVSLTCGAFFLVQPLFIAAERWMNMRLWWTVARRAWTFAVLAITSPLFVEPMLQLIEPTWGTPNQVLPPTLQVLGLVVFMNVLVSLGSFASIGNSPSTRWSKAERAVMQPAGRK